MLEALTTEFTIASSIIGACVLAFAGSGYMLLSKKPETPDIDVDTAVRNAPYHRLQNILNVADS